MSTNVPFKFEEYFGQKLLCNWLLSLSLFLSFFLLFFFFFLFVARSFAFVILYVIVLHLSLRISIAGNSEYLIGIRNGEYVYVMADSIDNIVFDRLEKFLEQNGAGAKRNIFQNDFPLDKAVNNSRAIVSRWFHVAHRKHTVFVSAPLYYSPVFEWHETRLMTCKCGYDLTRHEDSQKRGKIVAPFRGESK